MERTKMTIKVKTTNGIEVIKLVEYNHEVDSKTKRKMVKKELNKIINDNKLRKK
jgi:uncharacterized membrane protein